ncbi:MAG: hypothetical protein L0H96_22090 [Humibacillus sp.]|nr:hypothetical protein [Humibacillus sp.]MDN5779585.1 hypothetical protein [Humibacillus sp.]
MSEGRTLQRSHEPHEQLARRRGTPTRRQDFGWQPGVVVGESAPVVDDAEMGDEAS